MVQAAQANNTGKLVGKDYIFIAIFGLLLFLVFMAFAMIMGMNASTFWFTHAIAAVPAGIVWMYLLARVPKRGTVLIASVIVALVGLLLGMLWTGPVGIVIGGVIGELIVSTGKRSTAKNIIAFVVFTLCFWVGQEAMIFVAGQSYVDIVVASGMSAEYGQGLVDALYSPVIVVAGICCIVGPIVGGLLGSKLFKKHFAKISA